MAEPRQVVNLHEEFHLAQLRLLASSEPIDGVTPGNLRVLLSVLASEVLLLRMRLRQLERNTLDG